MRSLTVAAKKEELETVQAFIDGILEEHDCPMKTQFQIDVAVEEIFVNIAHYAYPGGKGDVKLSVLDAGDSVKLRFTDSGVAFDPLKRTDPDITLSAEERSIGGLGIYMVKKSMDDVCYERKNDCNVLTLTKKLK